MHECLDCGCDCDCDCDDTWFDEPPDDCSHECDGLDDEDFDDWGDDDE